MEGENALLVLEDGTVFKGKSIGKTGTTTGEIAFNTGMTGYQEVFTDPSYYGQILITTTTHIGNYGVHDEEYESDSVQISGLVCKKFSHTYSRPSASGSLNDYLKSHGTVGISDVDTRMLVRHIRSKGAMNAIISSENLNVDELKKAVKEVPSMEGLELSSKVSGKEKWVMGEGKTYKVALLDLGVKLNIARCLAERNCEVHIFPMKSSLEEMLKVKPDGFMISNGPGDPGVMKDTISLVKNIIDTGIPVFGICMGHQIIALSQNLKTEKMFNGHRGLNHPIKNLLTGKGEITSQNHGFVVSEESIKSNSEVELTHTHLNDGSVAGLRLKNKPVFCVQYHPEASAGPHDSRYLFDDFVNLMQKHK